MRWAGRVNRSDLTEFFGISVPQASADVDEYKRVAPQNVAYDASSRAFVATPEFVPAVASPDPLRYLNDLLAVEAGVLGEEESFLGWRPAFARVLQPKRQLTPSVFYVLVAAIRTRSAAQIVYQSMNRPATLARVVSPHALVFDGYRWHIRAYCHLHRDFRDFAIGRISAASLDETAGESVEKDDAWNELLRLVLVPNPDLSPAQRRAIAIDYGMEGGSITYNVRRSLLLYTLQHLGLDPGLTSPAKAKHIVLANAAELEPYLVTLARRGLSSQPTSIEGEKS